MDRFHYILIALLSLCPCEAQSIIVAAKGGFRATADVSGPATSESKRYAAGPAIEVGLTRHILIEGGLLYRRHGYRTGTGGPSFTALFQERAKVWEVPVLLEREWGGRHAFFAGGGFSLQSIRGTESTLTTAINPITGQQDTGNFRRDTAWETGKGLTAASGMRFRHGRLVVSAEIRYTRWLTPAIDAARPGGFAYRSAANQVDGLLGIGWKVR